MNSRTASDLRSDSRENLPALRGWLLKDSSTGEFFTLPHGEDHKEWSTDLSKAHHFATEERARGGATLWLHLHNKALTVIDYTHAVQFQRLGSDD